MHSIWGGDFSHLPDFTQKLRRPSQTRRGSLGLKTISWSRCTYLNWMSQREVWQMVMGEVGQGCGKGYKEVWQGL